MKKKLSKKKIPARNWWFFSVVLLLVAIIYFVRAGFSGSLSSDVMFGINLFEHDVAKDLLTLAIFLIFFVIWVFVFWNKNRAVLIFSLLSLVYFFASYFYFFSFSIKNQTLTMNFYFLLSLLAWLLVDYIFVCIYSRKWAIKKMIKYHEWFHSFGDNTKRKYHIQRAVNFNLTTSHLEIIIIWAIFMTILLNGVSAIIISTMLLFFYFFIYSLAYWRLAYLKKATLINEKA